MEKIIQITAAKGPAECQAVVAKVLKVFISEARGQGLICNVLDRQKGSINGNIKSVTIQLEGSKSIDFLKNWLGTIQWIGQSEFRKQHRRKNWFIGFFELDLSNMTFQISDKDIRFESTRSGGPGGQHVNKVSTAVRATHLHTGLSVLASDSRSQIQNKKMARQRLINKLKARQLEDKQKNVKGQWQNHQELERGNPVKIFKGIDFKSTYVEKSYKKERIRNKQRVREWVETTG
jgi:peptide chain release factor